MTGAGHGVLVRPVDALGARGHYLGGVPATPILFLLVGLPGTGKTIRARALEAERGALRLSPD